MNDLTGLFGVARDRGVGAAAEDYRLLVRAREYTDSVLLEPDTYDDIAELLADVLVGFDDEDVAWLLRPALALGRRALPEVPDTHSCRAELASLVSAAIADSVQRGDLPADHLDEALELAGIGTVVRCRRRIPRALRVESRVPDRAGRGDWCAGRRSLAGAVQWLELALARTAPSDAARPWRLARLSSHIGEAVRIPSWQHAQLTVPSMYVRRAKE
ncbi:hypothetical protein [Nocardia jiangsuensis]|uniref:Uncharacterized protein n=1 Tax=Nocardia jiangsuensis TaxID=1691563 RepID=A0ABV8DY77_9NOCA